MALGRKSKTTGKLFVATADLPRSAGHPFYGALNRLLEESGFDRKVEAMCEPFYADQRGRPSIPPGVYFRMLFVGYFEGIDSQRGIAWRCADSFAIRDFLGIGLTGKSPDHSSLTIIRQRLSSEVHESVFALVLGIAREKKLLQVKTIAVDATLLDANAAMKSIVRKDTGDDYKTYLRKLAKEAGIEDPSDDDLRRFDRDRGGKKTSNDEWESKTDPDSRVMKMKDGRTHLSYKAEHAIDLENEIVIAATIHPGNRSDTQSLEATLTQAQAVLEDVEPDAVIEEVVADKGYHSAEALTTCAASGLRTYIPVKKQRGRRRFAGKPEEVKRAVVANARRAESRRARRLLRQRSERVERSFAHICTTGGARRSWLKGFVDVSKRYLMTVAAHNLGRVLFALCGIGKPKGLQAAMAAFLATLLDLLGRFTRLLIAIRTLVTSPERRPVHFDSRYAHSVVA